MPKLVIKHRKEVAAKLLLSLRALVGGAGRGVVHVNKNLGKD